MCFVASFTGNRLSLRKPSLTGRKGRGLLSGPGSLPINPQPEAPLSLVEIELLTGRHHQIRVQMAGHGTPLYGDSKYGDSKKSPWAGPLALCAVRLSFFHPAGGKEMCFEIKEKGGAFDLF